MPFTRRLTALSLLIVVAAGLVAAAPASARFAPGDEPVTDDWLAVVNYYRATAYLPPVTEDESMSAGDQKHAEYLVRNDLVAHQEDPTLPGYTTAGNLAGQSSNVAGGSAHATAREMVEFWMRSPFHGIGMLRPRLRKVGFGIAHDNRGLQTAAALDVLNGLGATMLPDIDFPIEWPGNGTTQPLRSFFGGEYPDPLTACPGYETPTSVPLIIQFENPVRVSSFSFEDASGTRLASCEIDASNYVNPNGAAQRLGRLLLGADNVVFVIPREPLVAGATYSLDVTSNGEKAHSKFTVTDLDGARITGLRTTLGCSRATADPCTVPFSLADDAEVTFKIKNRYGNVVHREALGSLGAGPNSFSWNKRNLREALVALGTYSYELIAIDAGGNRRVARGTIRVTS